jgi:O-antigen/teichoic acid export membrane protein
MNQALKSGIIFTTIGKFSNLVTILIVNAVLSRLLSPDDYGVVATVQVFILFFQMLVEAGMGPAIIQNKKLPNRDIGILFNYSIILAIILSVAFGFFGNFLVYFYDNPIYLKIAWIQSIAILISGLNVVPTALLNKEKRFKKVNFNQVISSIISGGVGVLFAYLGFGVYALIFQAITLAGIFFVSNILAVRIQFQKELDIKVLKKILGFSINQFGFNFINYFSRNADNILVGKTMGPAALGNYSKAYQLFMMPNNILLGIISPVLQPVLSDYQDDVVTVKETFFKVINFLALIGVSLSIFLSIFSREIIEFLFGNQWGEAVLPFRILALTIWIQMTLSSTGAIFQARNKARELMITGTISAIVLVSSIVIGVYTQDLVKLAICISIGFLLNFLVSFYRLMHLVLEDTLTSLIKVFIKPFMVGGVVFLGLILTKSIVITNAFLYLVVESIAFGVLVLLGLIVTGEFKLIKELLKK